MWKTHSVFAPVLLAIVLALTGAGCSKKSKQASIQARADGYFKSGEYDKAKIEYMNLLRSDNQNATAFQQLGLIWYEQGSPLQAFPFLLKSRDLAPGNVDVRTKLAYAFIAVGQWAEARKEALAILEKSPGYDDAVILLAETVQTKEELEETAKRLEEIKKERETAAVHLAFAILATRRGEPAAAEAEVQKAIAVDPKSIPAHLAMANIWLGKKDMTRAGESLKAAYELAPPRSAARLRYVEFRLTVGPLEEARTILKEMTQKTPDYLTAWRLLAQIAFAEKKYDESLALLDNLFNRDGSNLEARILQSEIFLLKGEVAKAIEALERLRKSWARSPVVMYQLGRAYFRGGNLAQAGVILEEAVKASPAYADAVVLRGEVNLLTGGAKEAMTAMQDLLNRRPGLPEAEFVLARAYRLLGRPADAAAIFDGQAKSDPKNTLAQLRLGTVLREMGKLPEARAVLDKAQELEPDNLLVTYQLIELELAAKDFDSAHRRVDAHLKKTPESAGAHFLSGRIFAAQRDWDRAEAALKKAIELDANVPFGYETLIETYLAAGRLPEAVKGLEATLAKKPDDERTVLMIAMLHEKMNALPKARESYEKLLAIKPDFVPGLNNSAVFYTERMPDLEKAHELARKARTLDPNNPAVADTLGWLLYKRGDYQQALALLVESAGKLPENPEIQFHLGMANYMMGQTEAARAALQVAMKSTAEFPGKEEAARRLALLGDGSGKQADLPVNELEALVKQQPDDPLARVRLGEAYEKQGAHPKAAAEYEEALKRNPKMLTATIKLAQLYAGPLKDGAKALDLAKKARALAPNDPATGEALGRVSYQTGNYAAAYSMLQESARQPNAGAAVLYDFARAAYALGKVAQSQEILRRVVAAGAGSPEAEDAKSFLGMSVLEQDPKDLAAAEPEVQKLLAANPSHLPALMVRTAMQAQRGDTKAAAAGYTEILSRFPDFAPAQKRLASLYAADSAMRDKAYELAAKALTNLPEDPELAQTLAELSYHRKQFTSAIQLYKQSAGKRPLNAKALYYLGMAHVQQKEKPQGRDALTRALGAGLEEPLAGEVKRTLDELKE